VVITGRLIPAETGVARLITWRRRDRAAVTVANTVAKPTDKARPVRTTVECPSSARTATDGPGRCAYSYVRRLGVRVPPSAPRSVAPYQIRKGPFCCSWEPRWEPRAHVSRRTEPGSSTHGDERGHSGPSLLPCHVRGTSGGKQRSCAASGPTGDFAQPGLGVVVSILSALAQLIHVACAGQAAGQGVPGGSVSQVGQDPQGVRPG